MGAHVNYYSIIYDLVLLKNELYRVKQEKFQRLIRELCKYKILPDDDNDHLPDHKTLAKKLNFSQAKTNQLIKGLLNELIGDFISSPLKIKQCSQQIYIHLPFDEERSLDKKVLENFQKRTTWVEVQLYPPY